MPQSPLIDLAKKGPLFLDGAMGTQLMLAGVRGNDYCSLESPEAVRSVHEAYRNAGSHALITNTIGASPHALSRHGHADKVEQINLAATRLARSVVGPGGYVLGDIGPCGDLIEPLGTVKPDELRTALARQAAVLGRAGVDAFIIETMIAIEEVVVAAEAVRSVSQLPIFACMSFDLAPNGFRTMMGVSPADMIARLQPLQLDAIGYNCGTLTMDDYMRLTEVFALALEPTNTLLIAQPNAGKPQLLDGKPAYDLSVPDFADAMLQIRQAGAHILGGCCGTTPDHIRRMIETIDGPRYD